MSRVTQAKLDEIKAKAKEFRAYLKKNYPYKEISEYTRVDLDLDEFIRYGAWEPWDDN